MSLTKLTHAFEEVLTLEVFGKVPLTQSDMNESAYRSFKKADDEMQAVAYGTATTMHVRPQKNEASECNAACVGTISQAPISISARSSRRWDHRPTTKKSRGRGTYR